MQLKGSFVFFLHPSPIHQVKEEIKHNFSSAKNTDVCSMAISLDSVLNWPHDSILKVANTGTANTAAKHCMQVLQNAFCCRVRMPKVL